MSVSKYIEETWDSTIVPTLTEYIKIPNQSPDYDKEIFTNGLQEKAFALLKNWLDEHKPQGAVVTLHEEKNRTPFVHVSVPPFMNGKGHILAYSHFDKQPPMLPWDEGLGPHTPVIREGRLYGRGGADDGYGIFAGITALIDVQRRGKPHGQIHFVVEGAEESDSGDLEYWISKLKDSFGPVDFVICLDAGAMSYDRLWVTETLRGNGLAYVSVETSKDSIHSGIGGGVVPDPLRLLRMLVERIEDTQTGNIKVKALNVPIPEAVIRNLSAFKEMPHEEFMKQFTFVEGCHPFTNDNVELMLATTWRPCITITGLDAVPATNIGGNVIRTGAKMKISIRLPPTADPEAARQEMKELIEKDPPYGCRVKFEAAPFSGGWKAPEIKPWLDAAFKLASSTSFGKTYGAIGCGGSIPLFHSLGKLFPQAQYCITGVLGPNSNAHGPNEFLDIKFGKGVTNCISVLIEEHAANAAHTTCTC